MVGKYIRDFLEVSGRVLGVTSPAWWPVVVGNIGDYVAHAHMRDELIVVDYLFLMNILFFMWFFTIPLALFCIWWRVSFSWRTRALFTVLVTVILTPITGYTLAYMVIALTGGV